MKKNVNGININFEITGKGKIVVFLHGWGGNLHSFYPITRLLDYQSVLIDLPGFGKSDIPNSTIDSFEYANYIQKLIEELKIDEAILVGHSFGGKVAAIIASNNPKWLKGLVLISSPGIKTKKKLKITIKIFFYKFLKKIISVFPKKEIILEKLKNKFGSEDFKRSTGTMREILKKVVNEDISDTIQSIKCKTLLIWGENDKDVPVSIGKKYNEKIRNSRLIIYKNAGHFPYIENFEKFLSDFNNFLSEVYKND
ncbi:alpha/beta fold hydrolase [Thermosipho atlanticus]|uniref:Pimeloyl-ACP methyl ester carboxylesterase n=1 Tax=Thermosipho atlanticus DSM 15807 TaxID=1123380 RepID=A0A1M5T8T7_9BACT|nr:alpha/beta hydrolase [Thermosipho atlanticus]SHH47116.1 Pimeloyl-ACP methyl ester carboxylesterase [Thermosipho atlanticus DSM 15807]